MSRPPGDGEGESRAEAARRYVDRCRSAGELRETIDLLLDLGIEEKYATELLIELVASGPGVASAGAA